MEFHVLDPVININHAIVLFLVLVVCVEVFCFCSFLIIFSFHIVVIIGNPGEFFSLLMKNMFLFCVIVNGSWVTWATWGSCAGTCGNGTRTSKFDIEKEIVW
jgi:4-hydroxybenzoate polyprenyltransferase